MKLNNALLLLTIVCTTELAHSALSSSLKFTIADDQCKHSPSVWCGSEDVAESCGVLTQCRNAQAELKQSGASPVNVTLYMESLCPDCRAFFQTQLYPAWQKLATSGIVNIRVVPYGNAREHIQGHRWIFECQHGPAECELNQIETCAIGILRSPSRWMPYLNCLEQRVSSRNVLSVAEQCARSFNVSFDHINTCSHNEWGDMLQHHMAVETEGLKPQHTYVPWVTVNGAHNEEIQKHAESNLLQLICSTYKGAKPKACAQTMSRCYRDFN